MEDLKEKLGSNINISLVSLVDTMTGSSKM